LHKSGDNLPVTLMVMTYNREHFVLPAVESALQQDYSGPLEILISDDASTDNTREILRELVAAYTGPHSIRLNINNYNMGLIAHFEKAVLMARHDLVVCAADDDISRQDRVSKLVDLYRRTDAWLLYSAVEFMAPDGTPLPDFKIDTTFSNEWDLVDVAKSWAVFIGATAAYHKNLLKILGPIVERDAYEDLVLSFRAALTCKLAYSAEPLLRYRLGVGMSATGSEEPSSRERVLRTMRAVYRQRMVDAKGFGLAFDHPVMLALRESLSAVAAELCNIRGDVERH